ncbi:MAG: hypothetical protein WCJ03_06860 [Bacteroidales bacterium]|jgi:acyl-CoA synthetase (AMP-forming)/AMP-acid ligase II
MGENKSNRREFLTKLGLVLGAATLSATGVSKVVKDREIQITLTPDQANFAKVYEKWLKEFHEMAKIQKTDPRNLENNNRLMALSAEAQQWQKQLHEYMHDENFVRYHTLVTERITETI